MAAARRGVWFWVRLACIGSAVVLSQLASVVGPSDPLPVPWLPLGAAALLSLLFMPFMLLAVIGVQAVNPMSDDRWSVPRHDTNPFRLGDPLHLFHFAAFLIIGCGIGSIVGAIWAGWLSLGMGLFQVLGGLMLLLSVRWCIKVYKHKYVPEDAADYLEQAGGSR
jgi:hypothetical protein